VDEFTGTIAFTTGGRDAGTAGGFRHHRLVWVDELPETKRPPEREELRTLVESFPDARNVATSPLIGLTLKASTSRESSSLRNSPTATCSSSPTTKNCIDFINRA
jgi:hypothetical protein